MPGSQRRRLTVLGPTGAEVEASWLMLPDGTAVVELAETSGLAHLTELAPLDAHTFGFGQAIAAALDARVQGLLLALGGSASTDGGSEPSWRSARGSPTPTAAHPARQPRARHARPRRPLGSAALPPGGVRILSDVTNPLLGPHGAAAVFGPQKGATPSRWSTWRRDSSVSPRLLGRRPARSGAGAAGGTGYGLLAWGATLAPGAAAVGEALGLPELVSSADAVITGEGRFDSQSAAGKVPAYVARLAKTSGVPVLLVAGAIEAPTTAFAAAASLSELAGDPAPALSDASHWAHAAGAALARA